MSLASLLRGIGRTLGGVVLCTATCFANEHGVFEKPLWSFGKQNRATRGRTDGKLATKLYMMQPPEYLTGSRQAVGVRFTMQDEDASTSEMCTLHLVRFAKDGKSPDTSTAGSLASLRVALFGRGMKGTTAFEYQITLGKQVALPQNFGFAIEMPGNSKWPRDGASLHAQLNLPKDSRRLRVPPPHDKQVWAFEQSASYPAAVALGGRTLDVLNITGQYTEPVIQFYSVTKAYGLGTETLFGPEAYYPLSSRGDQFGVAIDAGLTFGGAWAFLFVSPKLAKNPLRFPPSRPTPTYFYLDLAAPFPLPWMVTKLDVIGTLDVAGQPFANVPKSFRSFWVQAVLAEPVSKLVEVTGAVRIQGQ